MDNVREIAWRTYGQTDVTALALLITGAMAVWLLCAARSRALLPLLVVAHLIPNSARIVIAGVDLPMLRLLVLLGLGRAFLRGELRDAFRRFTALDLAFGVWVLCGALFETLRLMDVGTVVYRVGVSLDALGIYMLVRALLRTSAEWLQMTRALAPLLLLIALGMAAETAGSNPFRVTGASSYTLIRDGSIRPAGPFEHPVLAGSYGATLFPIYFSLMLAAPARRWTMALGAAASFAIAALSHSSGAVMTLGAAMACMALWPVRSLLPQLRMLALAFAVIIHFAREMPIWHLIVRISSFLGGGGYHRFQLIDAAVNNFGDWWLVGTDNTMYWGWGLQDLTNQFVFEGVRGGVWTVLAFVTAIWLAFRAIQTALRRSEQREGRSGPQGRGRQLLLWGLGSCLAAHCVAFISVSYFGQVQLLFYSHIAAIGALAHQRIAPRARPATIAAPRPTTAPPRPAGPRGIPRAAAVQAPLAH